MALSIAGLASGLAGADSSALAVDSLGEVVLASEAFSFDTSGAFPAGAGSVAFPSTVADGSTPGLSTDGTSALGLAVSSDAGVSVLGLVASADAGASVLGAGLSASAELAEKAVPASADGTSLSSVNPVRLLVALEVPPPDVSAFSVGNYIARSGRGTL